MARVVWAPQALADLDAAAAYLARDRPAYAQAFSDGAFDAVARLALFPHSGRAVPETESTSIREVLYRGYRLIHVVSGPEGDEEVKVLTVIHSTRSLGA